MADPDPDPIAVGLLAVRTNLGTLREEFARLGHYDLAAALWAADGCVGLLELQVVELRAEVAELRRQVEALRQG